MRIALNALAYARQRRQFGRPISEFQGMAFMLADTAMRVATDAVQVFGAYVTRPTTPWSA